MRAKAGPGHLPAYRLLRRLSATDEEEMIAARTVKRRRYVSQFWRPKKTSLLAVSYLIHVNIPKKEFD
jgi:hypothetical protein